MTDRYRLQLFVYSRLPIGRIRIGSESLSKIKVTVGSDGNARRGMSGCTRKAAEWLLDGSSNPPSINGPTG